MAVVILPGFNNGCQLRTPALGEKTRNKAPRKGFLYLLRVKTSSMVSGLFISPVLLTKAILPVGNRRVNGALKLRWNTRVLKTASATPEPSDTQEAAAT